MESINLRESVRGDIGGGGKDTGGGGVGMKGKQYVM